MSRIVNLLLIYLLMYNQYLDVELFKNVGGCDFKYKIIKGLIYCQHTYWECGQNVELEIVEHIEIHKLKTIQTSKSEDSRLLDKSMRSFIGA